MGTGRLNLFQWLSPLPMYESEGNKGVDVLILRWLKSQIPSEAFRWTRGMVVKIDVLYWL